MEYSDKSLRIETASKGKKIHEGVAEFIYGITTITKQ